MTERVAYTLRCLEQVVSALACAHCNDLELASSCRACRCSGNTLVTFVLPHVVCLGCSTTQPRELIGDLLVTEVGVPA